jgi:hypothetical protein
MAMATKTKTPPQVQGDPDEVFEDFDALTDLAQKSFDQAVANVVEENARLGLPLHGAEDGKLVTRQPTGRRDAKRERDPG